MKILAVIPARAGSKGIPNKNIRIINGKPLMPTTRHIYLSRMVLTVILAILSSKLEVMQEYCSTIRTRLRSRLIPCALRTDQIPPTTI